MAQMRALENGRYMIRGTNNGVSAIIDQRGQIAGCGITLLLMVLMYLEFWREKT